MNFAPLIYALTLVAVLPLIRAYAPQFVPCGEEAVVRNAGPSGTQALSADESNYIETRRSAFAPSAYSDYLSNVQNTLSSNITLPHYVTSILSSTNASVLPRLGIAASGGGYRATIVGAGELNGLDGRNATSAEVGTGGLLQAADYLAGLSGGSWLVTSLSQAGFTTIRELAFGVGEWGGWNALFDILEPADDTNTTSQFLPGGVNATEANEIVVERIIELMSVKFDAGFPVSLADYWSFALAYHFVNGTTPMNFFNTSLPHGTDLTFSGLMNISSLRSFSQPFPIITMLTESPNENTSNIEAEELIPLTNTQYEFTPFEFGSFDTALSAFLPTHLFGTSFSSGLPTNSSLCAQDFDIAALAFGISSNVFPQDNVTSDIFFESLGALATVVNETFFEGGKQVGLQMDTANVPNPFMGTGNGNYLDVNETILRMTDGGINGEVTPYAPLITSARALDIIIGLDNEADTSENYAAGLSLSSTFNRSLLVPNYRFPVIPSPETFVEEGLNLHTTFFGCNDTTVPLIVWVPNSPPVDGSMGVTNTTTAQLKYNSTQIESMLEGASELIYRGFPPNGTARDPAFPACLACAVVDRARDRMGVERDGVCGECFARYCWFP